MSDEDLETRIRLIEQEVDAAPEPKSTWFLEPERATTPLLAAQVARAAGSPILDAILKTGAGAIAVLNEQRQVIALNAAYLQLLGVDEPGAMLGLRHGEAVRCVQSNEASPNGCGTSVACRPCGAAILAAAGRKEAVDYNRPGDYFNWLNQMVDQLQFKPQVQELAG